MSHNHNTRVLAISGGIIASGLALVAWGFLWAAVIFMVIFMSIVLLHAGGGRYFENKKFSDISWATLLVMPLFLSVGSTIICIATGQYGLGWFEPLPAGLIAIYMEACLFWIALLWIVNETSYPEDPIKLLVAG